MDDRQLKGSGEDEIDLGKYYAILRDAWWKITLFSVGSGLMTLFLMSLSPNSYRATAVITPVAEEKRDFPSLGVLASFGVSVGGASKVEDLESLFKSNDLTAQVFRRHDLWPILRRDRYDAATGKMRPSFVSRWFLGEKEVRLPGDWDAIREAGDRMTVFANRRTGILSISFESPSPTASAEILNHYLEEGKSRLQHEAFSRAETNKRFIQEQIGKTVDALTRERLYTLYGQEVEREMLARNREQFGFRIIDSPRAPDRKSRPRRARAAVTMAVLSFLVGSLYCLFRRRRRVS